MTKARKLADLGNVYDDGALSHRNLLINSEFKVNQRGVTSITGHTSSAVFTADRWLSYASGGVTSTISVQDVTLPNGKRVKSHKTLCTAGSGSWLHPFQKVESFGLDFLKGKTLTLSAWVKTNMTNQKVRFCDGAACHLLGDVIPNDGEWHFISVNHIMRTDMVTGSADFMQFQPAFTASGTPVVVGSYIEFALPQMEIGDTATPFEHRSYGDELARCQRYFYKANVPMYAHGQYESGSFANKQVSTFQFPVTMRVYPSVTHSYTNRDNTASLTTNNLANSILDNGIRLQTTCSVTSYPYCYFDYHGSFDAEL